MPSYSDDQGKSISLVKDIAKGGEGTIWQTNRSGYLAKTYHNPSNEQITKLQLMVANPPQNPTAGMGHIAISWPNNLIKDNQGRWVGFLMPEIKNAKELVYVYHPTNRNKHAPAFNWYCLHIIAYNFASILREIHAKNYIIGDISVKNILVNERSLVSLIDTDSFQVTDPNKNLVYRCSVGSEGFTPPELIGQTLSQLTQNRYHDRFRLAVIIHYLLFGSHPFMGKWTGSGNPPGQNDAISQGHWPYGINSLLKPSPNTIPLNVLHPKLGQCFTKCFNDGHQSPTSRPSPEDWVDALEVAINDLVVCSKNPNHIYSQHFRHCYWCDRAKALSVDIFPAVKNPIAPQKISITPPPPPPVTIQQLQSQNQSLNQQLAQANTQLSTLQSNNQSLNQQLAQVNQKVSTLQSDNQSLNQQLATVSQNSHHTSQLSQQVQRLEIIKKIAITSTIISTIAATAFGGLSFLQYQERNQLIRQIEQIRRQNNLPSGRWDLSSNISNNCPSLHPDQGFIADYWRCLSYSLDKELENLGKIIKDEKPLVSRDLDELINKMQENTETSINELNQRISNLAAIKTDLENQNNSQQNRINELVNQNNSQQNRINELVNQNNSQQNRINGLVNQNNSQQNRINELVNQNQSLQNRIKELEGATTPPI
ncbi:hypothetical protein [Planktothricoides raciborskii]|uniref:Protein kinase domain-containing protein n=1 Tax=Planktothricoides raciborskii FACHB-1370 TaxID=2949576 RepID=A0ABR8EAU9_9CYAN|nr:hypothetical protein [Planktothricoides raciborskii]MBD2543685.1 hypothetical protein [Planktothricoides raciborskii FACHB-1370]MBD2582422.1 hypothetical protein [Planktothricoides raciborskii FACHB-1261]